MFVTFIVVSFCNFFSKRIEAFRLLSYFYCEVHQGQFNIYDMFIASVDIFSTTKDMLCIDLIQIHVACILTYHTYKLSTNY